MTKIAVWTAHGRGAKVAKCRSPKSDKDVRGAPRTCSARPTRQPANSKAKSHAGLTTSFPTNFAVHPGTTQCAWRRHDNCLTPDHMNHNETEASASWRRGYAPDCKSGSFLFPTNVLTHQSYQDEPKTKAEPDNRQTSTSSRAVAVDVDCCDLQFRAQ